jgi:hypothetical protein
MKNKVEKFVLFLLIAPLAPLAGFIGAWALAYTFLPEGWIPATVLCGVLLGILADFFILKKLLRQVHQLSLVFWMAVMLFYSVGLFGLFMGVPVFNVALAVPAGFVIGARLAAEQADSSRVRKKTLQTCLVTTGLMAIVCMASAWFALTSSSTPADLEGMLGLGFSLTPVMIWGIILVGGTGLLLVNWVLTSISAHLTYRFMR